ncbi:Ras- protein Rab-18 [Xenoophorus captivus]|uniref:Ras- protein Rab-18 n=1 Tax=Xenoophorus captivus TaxID=1517983 RepID=A0ABV0RNK5_9TELE
MCLHNALKVHFKSLFVFLSVYDVTRRDSFTKLENWLNELETYTTRNDIVKMLVGNKIDKASAKTKDGVQCAFEELVEKILQTPGLWESDNQGQKVQLGHQEQGRGRACGGYCSIP